MRKRPPLFWMALAGLICLSALMLWFLVLGRGEPDFTDSRQSGDPEFKMRGSDTWEYRDDGSPRYRLQAKTASFDTKQLIGRFTDVRFTVYEKNASVPPWIVNANEASLVRLGTRTLFTNWSKTHIGISLKEQVKVEKTYSDGTLFSLQSSQLHYSGETNSISADTDIKQRIKPPNAPIITLVAGGFNYDQANSILLYSGGVELARARLSLSSETLQLTLDEARISDAQAYGDPAHFTHQDNSGTASSGSAKVISYKPEKQLLLLVGDATLERSRGTLTGTRIQYNLDTRTVTAEATPSPLASPSTKTQGP